MSFVFQAASLLKKTEGIVSLVVCNPNKVKEDEKKVAETGVNVSSSISAPQSSAAAPAAAAASHSPKDPEKPSESQNTMLHSLSLMLVCFAVLLTTRFSICILNFSAYYEVCWNGISVFVM